MKHYLYLIFKYFLILLGFCMFSFLLWLRYIRERVPRGIPFHLTELGFYILICVCFIYFYLIYTLLTPRPSHPLIVKLVSWLYKPLEAFDAYIKSFVPLSYYHRFIIYLAYKLEYSLVDTFFYYNFFAIFPRIILLSALYMDIFYFHRIAILYKVIIIGVLLFLNKYIIYSMKMVKEKLIEELEPLVYKVFTSPAEELVDEELVNEDDEDDEDDFDFDTLIGIPLRKFIEFQTENKVFRNYEASYYTSSTDLAKEIYCKKNNLPIGDFSTKQTWELTDILDAKVKDIIKLSANIESHKIGDHFSWFKTIKILIFINYIICWSYVLIISLEKLKEMPVTIEIIKYLEIIEYSKIIEPFSDLIL